MCPKTFGFFIMTILVLIHIKIITISDNINFSRMMVCYCHFQIHTVHIQTFHSRYPKCQPCTVTHDDPLLIRDPHTRKQNILRHMFV
jgi:hypothetical protein